MTVINFAELKLVMDAGQRFAARALNPSSTESFAKSSDLQRRLISIVIFGEELQLIRFFRYFSKYDGVSERQL